MFSRTILATLFAGAFVIVAGCSALQTNAPKPLREDSRITEEDVSEPKPQPPGDQPAVGTPQADPPGGVEASPATPPPKRTPRHIPWRDRRDGERGWEPSSVRPTERSR